MKILILPSWYLPIGGYFIQEQALFLQEKGIDVAILSNNSLSLTLNKKDYFLLPWRAYSRQENGLLTYRFFSRSIPRNESLNIETWCNYTLRLFEKYLREQGKPDLIHVHSSTWGGYAAALIKRKYGIPYIITEHRGVFALQCEYARQQFPIWKDPFFREAFGQADYLIPVSNQLMRKISEYTEGVVHWKAIPNIVDTDFFYDKKRERNERFHFVCINGYYKVKGYDILLKAFDQFCTDYPQVKLTIAGENFDCKEFQRLLSSCRNRDKIFFPGELSRIDVRALLWQADAFLLPSRVESQSISTLEALSTGLPVVCTDVVPEFVVQEFCGFRVTNEDPIAFAEGMIKMIQKKDIFDDKRISAHARKISHKEIIISQIIDVYKDVLSKQTVFQPFQ